MDKFEKIVKLHNLLKGRRTPLSLPTIADELECSERTAQRIVAALRDQVGAPIESAALGQGYVYNTTEQARYELPGLWFNEEEIHALLAAQQLLEGIGSSGLLDEHIQPLTERIQAILQHRHAGSADIAQRVRILAQASRHIKAHDFRKTATALLQRKQLHIAYRDRSSDVLSERNISPQRLVHYRDNWYLDAWCHERKALRTFALDRLQPLNLLDTPAKDIDEHRLNDELGTSYGIFSGKPDKTAVLHFSPVAARWVADEQWHPEQRSDVQTDGSVILHIPYHHPTELIMDILKWAGEVRVIEPDELMQEVKIKLTQAIKQY